jgi:hypothetical protein
MESGFALFVRSHFPTANRRPPSDQVRGHASPENALERDEEKWDRFSARIPESITFYDFGSNRSEIIAI